MPSATTADKSDSMAPSSAIAMPSGSTALSFSTLKVGKAGVGKDRVQISTADDTAAIAALKEKFSLDAKMVEGLVTISVPEGAAFIPQLFEKLGIAIKSVTVQRPTLDDVFLNFTGTSLRDAEQKGSNFNPRAAAFRR